MPRTDEPVRLLRIAGISFGIIGVLLFGFLGIGLLLSSQWEAERSGWIRAEPAQVWDHISSAEAWERWTPSPETATEYFGPGSGEGSGRRWDDPGYGEGSFVITEVDRDRLVRYEVEVESGSIRISGEMRLEVEDGGTRIHWREAGDFGRNPILGYLAPRMEELQGGQLEASLETLRILVEEGREIDQAPSADDTVGAADAAEQG
ncbi:MAG: hypothetical protein EA352_02040 [Gemmatimonadales bacterium]|nr:MAG: hypothetical protein EA352_02040 [Gemmatimonadales bacterium]